MQSDDDDDDDGIKHACMHDCTTHGKSMVYKPAKNSAMYHGSTMCVCRYIWMYRNEVLDSYLVREGGVPRLACKQAQLTGRQGCNRNNDTNNQLPTRIYLLRVYVFRYLIPCLSAAQPVHLFAINLFALLS
jgi:hypothetical protein